MFKTSETRESLDGKSGIYKITLIGTNRHYVGQSRRLWKRMRSYINDAHSKYAKKRKTKISYAIEKYGVEAFEFSVLAYCDIGNLNQLEAHFIARFNSCEEEGFNIQEFNSGERPVALNTEEYRERMRQANLGKKRSPETIERMRESARNKPPRTKESKAKQSASLSGRKLSDAHKQKLRDRLLGKKLPANWRDALKRHAESKGKPVIQFSMTGDQVAEYKSVSDACRATKIGCGNLVTHLKGRLKTCGGFIWKYAPNHAN